VYGVPQIAQSKNPLSPTSLATLLELAERMHKPLDLYQFVYEVR
jgi:hypothetical protein